MQLQCPGDADIPVMESQVLSREELTLEKKFGYGKNNLIGLIVECSWLFNMMVLFQKAVCCTSLNARHTIVKLFGTGPAPQ